MDILRKTVSLLLVFGLLAGLGACQTTRKVLDLETSARLDLRAASDVNPDGAQRPSPLVITVFTLTDRRQFEREDFLSLYENAAERLGADMVRSVRLRELAPGESRTESISLDPSVRYIGLLAEYSQYERAQAILVLPITSNRTNHFRIEAEQLRLTTR